MVDQAQVGLVEHMFHLSVLPVLSEYTIWEVINTKTLFLESVYQNTEVQMLDHNLHIKSSVIFFKMEN